MQAVIAYYIFKYKWRFNPSVHRAKGAKLVRATMLPVCDNGAILVVWP